MVVSSVSATMKHYFLHILYYYFDPKQWELKVPIQFYPIIYDSWIQKRFWRNWIYSIGIGDTTSPKVVFLRRIPDLLNKIVMWEKCAKTFLLCPEGFYPNNIVISWRHNNNPMINLEIAQGRQYLNNPSIYKLTVTDFYLAF